MAKKIKELETRLSSLQNDLTFVRHSGALKEVEDYLTNEITSVRGALVACSAYERASHGIDFPHVGLCI